MAGLEVAAVIELLGTIGELAERDSSAARTAVKEMIGVLRTIYFTPSGAVSMLEELANGERPSAERIADVLPDFNDKEWRITRELQRLDFQRLYKNGAVSIRQCHALEEISHRKRSVRASIQDFLNEALTTDEVPSSARARELLEEVRRLNSLIEDAEEDLRKADR